MLFVKNAQIWQIEVIPFTINIEIKVSFIVNIYVQVEIRDRPFIIGCIFIFELGVVVVVSSWHLVLQQPMQSLHIIIQVLTLHPTKVKVYSSMR